MHSHAFGLDFENFQITGHLAALKVEQLRIMQQFRKKNSSLSNDLQTIFQFFLLGRVTALKMIHIYLLQIHHNSLSLPKILTEVITSSFQQVSGHR